MFYNIFQPIFITDHNRYLTALGDLIGTFLLYIAFLILSVLSPDELHGGSVSIITSSTSTPISENASVVLPSAVNSP